MIDCTTWELIRLLRKPGKAFVCIAGTEILVAIDKSDMIATLEPLIAVYGNDKEWSYHIMDCGLHIEKNY